MPKKAVSVEQLISQLETKGVHVVSSQSGYKVKAQGTQTRSYACIQAQEALDAFLQGHLVTKGFVILQQGASLPVKMERVTRDSMGIKMRRPVVQLTEVQCGRHTTIVDPRWNTSAVAATGLLVEISKGVDEFHKTDRPDFDIRSSSRASSSSLVNSSLVNSSRLVDSSRLFHSSRLVDSSRLIAPPSANIFHHYVVDQMPGVFVAVKSHSASLKRDDSSKTKDDIPKSRVPLKSTMAKVQSVESESSSESSLSPSPSPSDSSLSSSSPSPSSPSDSSLSSSPSLPSSSSSSPSLPSSSSPSPSPSPSSDDECGKCGDKLVDGKCPKCDADKTSK